MGRRWRRFSCSAGNGREGQVDAQIPSRTVMEEINQGGGNRKTGLES